MGTPPPAPQGDAVPTEVISQQSPSGAVNQTSGGSQAKPGKGKLIGIILGSVLGVILIVMAILFFLQKEDPVVEPPAINLADYLKGKRFTYKLPADAVPAELKGTPMAQIMSQPVFIQFETNMVSQFGTTIKGRMVAMDKGTYSTEGLNLVIKKDGGNDTAVFTKPEPGVGDEVSLTDAKGKVMKLSIMKVEPAEPLESFNMAMMGSLGLGGGMPPGGLAGLLPTAGLPLGSSQSKGKGKKGKGKKGKGQSQGRPQAGYPARKMPWTHGAGGRDLVGWKGRTMQQVHQSFGNPDLREDTPAGGEWQYNNMNITDAQGKPHQTVTFVYMVNGMVVDVLLRPLLPATPKAVQ